MSLSSVIFLSLHDLGVMFVFGAFVAGMGLLLAEMAWRWEQRRSQAYYWTPEWQAAEAEAQADIEAGRVERFATAEEAIKWLRSD